MTTTTNRTDIDPRMARLWRERHPDGRGGSLLDGSAAMMPPCALYGVTCSVRLAALPGDTIAAWVALARPRTRAVAVWAHDGAEAETLARRDHLEPWRLVGAYQVDACGTTTQPPWNPGDGTRRYLVLFKWPGE